MFEEQATLNVSFSHNVSEFQNAIDQVNKSTQQTLISTQQLSRAGQQFGRTITNSLASAIIKGKDLRDVFRSLAHSLANKVLKSALDPLGNFLGNGISNLLGGGMSASGAAGGVSAFANSASILPFARGGVVNRPVMFPLGRGMTGLAGEAGAEAIIPLARGADGRLGVQSQGGGAGAVINFYVTARDAESFKNSESQIAAMLNRVVSAGGRNL